MLGKIAVAVILLGNLTLAFQVASSVEMHLVFQAEETQLH